MLIFSVVPSIYLSSVISQFWKLVAKRCETTVLFVTLKQIGHKTFHASGQLNVCSSFCPKMLKISYAHFIQFITFWFYYIPILNPRLNEKDFILIAEPLNCLQAAEELAGMYS